MDGRLLIFLAIFIPDVLGKKSGSCPASVKAANGGPKGTALLQSHQRKKKAANPSEEEDDEPPLFPEAQHERLGSTGLPISVQERLAMADQGEPVEEESGWLIMSKFNFNSTPRMMNLKYSLDDDEKTWGGAVDFRIDLGQRYKIDETYVDWRWCKCKTQGAVQLFFSQDNETWTVFREPKNLYADGGSIKKSYKNRWAGRFLRIKTTDLAESPFVGFWEVKLRGRADARLPNVYGWYSSYAASTSATLPKIAGTEILHLVPYRGELFGATGYWMWSGPFRPSEVVRLSKPYGKWKVEQPIHPFSGRTEILKAVTWTTDAEGNKLDEPMPQLFAGFYLDFMGKGRCYMGGRNDDIKGFWPTVYWQKPGKYEDNYLSARALHLYQDPITKIDRIFFVTGMDGIISGLKDPNSQGGATFPEETESGFVETRPLALVEMDGRLFFTASSYIMVRINGPNPKWKKIFDMADHDKQTIDEAVGGMRGITAITNPTSVSGHSLMFTWAANVKTRGCLVRLDPKKKTDPVKEDDLPDFSWTKEKCAADEMVKYLGKNRQGYDAKVIFVIASYNNVLELNTTEGLKHLIGVESLLHTYSTYDFPVDPGQVSRWGDGGRIGFYAGASYMIRHSPDNYEVRVPGGPRYGKDDIFPKQVAVRCYSKSPFENDTDSVYMGGYDCNHWPSRGTAWVQRAKKEAVWSKPVPCQKERGCGIKPGDMVRNMGCDWCNHGEFMPFEVANWEGAKGSEKPVRCQSVLDEINRRNPSNAQCKKTQKMDSVWNCCKKYCDICEGSGQPFQPTNIAGKFGESEPYTCADAKRIQKDSNHPCKNAQEWWQSACCTKEPVEPEKEEVAEPGVKAEGS